MRVSIALAAAAGSCTDSLVGRVMCAAGRAFEGIVLQLLENAGCGGDRHQQLIELQRLHGLGESGAGINAEGQVDRLCTAGGQPVRDLVCTKIAAISGAMQLVLDLLAVDRNLEQN